MTAIEYIKSKIKKQYRTDPNIHIRFRVSVPRTTDNAVPAVIMGVYPHIFCIEEKSGEKTLHHTVKYTDVLIGQIQIEEIGEIPKQ